MADLEIERSHDQGLAAARRAAEEVAQQLKALAGVKYHWEDNVLRLEKKGANGHITVSDDHVHVLVHLGPLYRPMRSMVETAVNGFLNERLGPA